MKLRRFAAALTIAAAALTVLPITVLAHGAHHGRARYSRTTVVRQAPVSANTIYTLCDIEDCVQTGLHSHSGSYHFGHYYGDGHDYHNLCGIYDCAAIGMHSHNDVNYFGHHAGDGHSYHVSGAYGRHH